MKSNGEVEQSESGQRLDTWLWASRFYKSRKIANDAVKGGHVAVNQQRAKPSKNIKLSDEIRIRRFPQTFVVVVTGLSEKRLSAPLAAALYEETEDSKMQREEKNQQMRDQRAGLKYERKRPGKRDREKMLRVKNQQPDW